MQLAPLALDRDPLDVLASLAPVGGACLVEVPDPARPVTLLGCAPVDELRVTASEPDAIAAIVRFVASAPRAEAALPFPLGGGVVACLTYELGAATVPGIARRDPGVPLAVLRRYDPMLVYDRVRGTWALVASDAGARAPWLECLTAPAPVFAGPLARGELAATLDREAYRAAVERIHDHLRAGDVYQVNLTQPFTVPLHGPAWALYQRVARRNPAPFGAYLDLGHAQVVANSPELWLRRRGRRVETRPIKGTRPRSADPVRDAALASELARDAKERAEHVMIVDLERNDLGRVCRVGSVAVESHACVESHPTVHHLVSVVSGELEDGAGLGDLLVAVFPGGSITGAPKRRAMQIIAEIEPGPRGVYTGAIGLVDPRGDVELGLPIRTGVVQDGRLRYHAGGGIVVDSVASRELDECWLKTAAIRAALGEGTSALERCSSG
ncbi:MAG TPA: aminodeoxychorismate synthase component I [Candidatus Eisenbacteria bacterium]|nr:aminodeoxychorismate synthase component I [Candidatus Eisenbacteria bacterium]